MAEPSILGALRDPQFRSDTLRNLVEALNGAKRSLTVGRLGAVGDMGNTLGNLVRAGAGVAYHETTGRPIPQALEYRDPARDFGTSASLGNFAERQGWLPPLTGSIPETAGALLGPIAAMGLPDLGNATLRGLVAAAKSEPSRRMIEGYVDALGGRSKIFAGENARTADKATLAKAQAMAQSGAPERAIWSDTGWFKGADGKWRFEIDDSGASVDVGKIPAGMSMVGDLPKAQNVVSHGRLFDAYPEVAANTYMGRASEGGGSFSDMSNRGPYKGLVSLNPNGHEGTNSVALHELQHAVQQREGFAPGGNPSSISLLDMVPAERIESVKQSPLYRLQVAQGRDPKKALEGILAPYLDEFGGGDAGNARMDAYRRLAGEAEARAVQSRMDMTPEQRRATFPFDSYDVPRDKLILRR
jgi:hypothetical protein